LVRRHISPGAFGVYPRPIEIYGMMIACTKADTSFLVDFGDAAGFTVGCVPPTIS